MMRSRAFLFAAILVIFNGFVDAQTSVTEMSVSGLKDTVTVRRDARSIPYVEAANDADLYFVQGWVTASDRLWQMDLMRRLARGETAEIFGNATLDQDKRWRRFGFAEIANESVSQLTPELRDALNNYARGVNAYLTSLYEKSLPVEFRILQYKPRQWSPTDTIVVGKILADALSTTWQNDLLRASMTGLSPEKYADATEQVTPYDVVLLGKDVPRKTSGLRQPTLPVDGATLASAEHEAGLRRDSLSMVGLLAEDLAASNN